MSADQSRTPLPSTASDDLSTRLAGPEPTRRFYLDLDGVMADFDAHFPAVFGLDHRGMADDAMWQTINAHPSYFRDMPPCPGAVEFFREIEHLRPIILTACPRTNYANAARQKRAWVREHLSDHVTVLPVMGGRNKPLFMQEPGDVLIDDFEKNTDAWREAGGIPILHRSFDETRRALASLVPAPTEAARGLDVTEEMVEAGARAGYESAQWKHKWPWERNAGAREAWTACAREMFEAVPRTSPPETVRTKFRVTDEGLDRAFAKMKDHDGGGWDRIHLKQAIELAVEPAALASPPETVGGGDALAALLGARAELEGYEYERTGESYNNVKLNAAIAHLQAVVAATPTPSAAQDAQECGWLCEMNDPPEWFVWPDEWTRDSRKAMRFARREDAENYIAETGWTTVKATEHLWTDERTKAALSSAPPAEETWQAIETAPTEGDLVNPPRYIDLWPGPFGNVAVGRYDPDQYAKTPRPFWTYFGWNTSTSRASPPTHWRERPLPPAPAGEGK